MRSAGAGALLLTMAICLLATAGTGSAESPRSTVGRPRVITDGRLRPGHLETMRVAGFPDRGIAEVSFFPTAICEDSCGARTFRVGKTNGEGAASFRVRVPGTFLDHRNRSAYFRDGERIDVNVTWEGADGGFAVGNAEPEPILVRVHGPRHG
jgi:hypothetical protein